VQEVRGSWVVGVQEVRRSWVVGVQVERGPKDPSRPRDYAPVIGALISVVAFIAFGYYRAAA